MSVSLYFYVNNITEDIYTGQTIYDSLQKRYSKDNYKGSPRFYNALQKYGLENFDRWIFKIVETQEEADQEEIFWIAETRRIFGKEHVYNIREGGFGGAQNEETKQKISKSHMGIGKGIIWTEERRQTMMKNRVGMTGKHHSLETRKKISMVNKDKTWKVINGKRVWLNKGAI